MSSLPPAEQPVASSHHVSSRRSSREHSEMRYRPFVPLGYSNEGRGTTFRIDLPQRQAGVTTAPREPASETKSSAPSAMAAASD
jgi:hypothetical protein